MNFALPSTLRYSLTIGSETNIRCFSESASRSTRLIELLHELPARPRIGKPDKAAVWVKRDNGIVAVTCTDCLRTFPVLDTITGINTVECEFCSCVIRFEIIDQHADK